MTIEDAEHKYEGPWVYIYVLKDPRNGNVRYVGKSVDPKQRYREHISGACISKNGNIYKDNWIRTLLEKDLEPNIEIIDKVPEWEWREAERYWVKYFRDELKEPLTNIEEGGKGPGCIAEETKEKISKSVKQWHTENDNPFEGRKHTEETKRIISKKAKARLKDPKNNPRYGVSFSHTDASKNKIRKTLKENKINVGSKNGQAKLSEEDVREIRSKYESGDYTQKELAEEFGVSPTTIWEIVHRRKWKHIQ